ncbi:Clavesin-1 [Microtus ochrogaster]|uniref:Clavesin-1 n=1 Tax=Microtus ochrogaster TaxID=79684 RepID=A0A8J6GUQ9_MICOH|nr:Clavesin-1 [Microtus ochrogaster]
MGPVSVLPKPQSLSTWEGDLAKMTHLQAGLSPDTIEKARLELNENPDVLHQDIQQVRDMIITRPDIGFLRTDDAFILRFLRARKFHQADAFRLLAQYFQYRQLNLDMFKNFKADDPGIKRALIDGFPGVLENRDHYGRKILLLFAANWDQSSPRSHEEGVGNTEAEKKHLSPLGTWRPGSSFPRGYLARTKTKSKQVKEKDADQARGRQKGSGHSGPWNRAGRYGKAYIGSMDIEDQGSREERNSFTDILRAILLSLEVLIEDPELQINGFILIIDWSNFSFKQASKLTPSILKLAIEGLQWESESSHKVLASVTDPTEIRLLPARRL